MSKSSSSILGGLDPIKLIAAQRALLICLFIGVRTRVTARSIRTGAVRWAVRMPAAAAVNALAGNGSEAR